MMPKGWAYSDDEPFWWQVPVVQHKPEVQPKTCMNKKSMIKGKRTTHDPAPE